MKLETKLKYFKLKYFFKHTIWLPFRAIYYFFYFMKYPFLQPRNVWTGKKCWTFSEDYFISPGWRKAFGKQLIKDLRKVLKEEKLLKTFYFLDIKEKWGALVLDGSGTSQKVDEVLRYYEKLSICYCEDCGKPARYKRIGGWMGYVCSDCFNKSLNELNITTAQKYKFRTQHRLKVKDIPTYRIYDTDGKARIDTNIPNYRQLWALNRRANLNVNTRTDIQK